MAKVIALGDAAVAYRHGLRFIHQELNIVPALTVAENLFINNPLPRLAGIFVDWQALNRRARAVLQQLGISHINPQRRASSLSAGDAMLVKIASAFIGEAESDEPLIYIMDEPTAALNSAEVTLLFDVIKLVCVPVDTLCSTSRIALMSCSASHSASPSCAMAAS